jgi:NIPSNAP
MPETLTGGYRLSPVPHTSKLRPSTLEETDMAFYELRQYHVRPGKMDEWVKIMEEEIIPFQVSKGMVICGSFRGETDQSVYVWLRRFESEAEREALYKAVYDTDYWKTKIAPRVPDCLDREKMVITRIVSTPKSVLA